MLKVECMNCKKKSDVSLLTRPLPSPFGDVVEVYLECPKCHFQKFVHFMSPAMLKKQLEIREAVNQWQKKQIRLNFIRLTKIREEYRNLFDLEQEKYKNFLDKKISLSLERVGDSHASES